MLEEYKILIAGSFYILSDKVLRIGHMGNNAKVEDMADTVEALDKVLRFLGFGIKYDIKFTFTESLQNRFG